MDAFQLLNTKVMDRIMKEYWNSNIDTSGSFLATSTNYQLLRSNRIGKEENEDIELKNRFYLHRDLNKIRSHFYVFKVYLKSMQTRYFIELGLFCIMAVTF